jgi:hypothetical protein
LDAFPEKDASWKKDGLDSFSVANGAKGKFKFSELFSFLYTILDQLGINQFPNSVLGRNAVWDDIYNNLQRTPYGRFCWCPSQNCRGGLAALNRKMIKDWPASCVRAQGIVLGILDSVPTGRFVIEKFENDKFPIRGCRIERHQICVAGDSQPYIMLAVCTPNESCKSRHSKYATPYFNRMILHSIVSRRSLIPVKSVHERRVAAILMRHGISFRKPLFAEYQSQSPQPNYIVSSKWAIEIIEEENPEGWINSLTGEGKIQPLQILRYMPGEKLSLFERRLLQQIGSVSRRPILQKMAG